MRAVLASQDLVTAVAAVLPGVQWQADRMRAALSPDLFATAEALRLVAEGTPFRDAYREIGTHLDRLGVPTEAEALAAYTSDGTPGNVDVVGLRERLD